MAPEVLGGENEYDSKCDIWSLGVLLLYLCTGNPIYKGRTIATQPGVNIELEAKYK